MTRKELAENSFQKEIVDFLEENAGKRFTAKEIREAINSRSGKSRTSGSMSGTLKALHAGDWILRFDDSRPSRYSYLQENAGVQRIASVPEPFKHSSNEQTSQDSILQRIGIDISNIRSKIANIDSKVEQLQQEQRQLEIERSGLKVALKSLENSIMV